jgi:peroxiredoxin (alkyl hydroperoxide reductase subunit C)
METLLTPAVIRQAQCLYIGAQVPSFEADSTMGRIRSEDYLGRWLVLFSYPADFTAVCSTEVVAFGNLYEELKDTGCQLLGLSTNSVSSHIPWLQSIEESLGERIEYPVIGDFDGRISSQYGLYMPAADEEESVRSTFIIDDKQMLRALLVYPAAVGRNTEEILRLVRALQASNVPGRATPANWQRGDDLLEISGANPQH